MEGKCANTGKFKNENDRSANGSERLKDWNACELVVCNDKSYETSLQKIFEACVVLRTTELHILSK